MGTRRTDLAWSIKIDATQLRRAMLLRLAQSVLSTLAVFFILLSMVAGALLETWLNRLVGLGPPENDIIAWLGRLLD
jgi:hypothetical protein